MRQEIADLKQEVDRKRAELADAERRLREARIAASPVKIGDIVIGTGRANLGKRFRVAVIDSRWEPPWLKGNPERADGSFGTALRSLYGDWRPE